jgi:micrococcal nuclease
MLCHSLRDKLIKVAGILALSAAPVTAADDVHAFLAKVSGVAGGDTITVSEEKKAYTLRLYGVRCPPRDRPWGKEAREFVTDLVFGKEVEVKLVSDFPGERPSAIVALGAQIINEELVKRGLAWVNTPVCRQPVCSKWKDLESEAKSERRGLWGGPGDPQSWQGRKKGRPKDRPPE